MPIKSLLLYIILILSICYFSIQLILSHLTHSLTLLMAAYHMLCNIFALAGSIVTIKHNELHNQQKLSSSLLNSDKQQKSITYPKDNNLAPVAISPELKIRNTFGWARIEILTMLIVCITLASLSFSLLVEALQTLVHIDHQDSMHLPLIVMILGFVGLLLNAFTYYFIGGYTLHQGNYLHINPRDGKVIVEQPSNMTVDGDIKILPVSDNSKNDAHLKEDLKTELGEVHYRTRREGPSELLRDVSSTIFVIVCAVIVYFAKDKEHTAKFIDPILAIFSCVLVVALSYPYMKEACLILLQTIPANIDMDNFEKTLKMRFPEIVDIHELHIWQMSSQKYIGTVHIIFKNSQLYNKTIDQVRDLFHDHSIANVTIQPEFYDENSGNSASTECLIQCKYAECLDKVCCTDSMADLREVSVCSGPNGHEHDHTHGHAHDHGHSHGHSHGHAKKTGKGKKNKEHHGHGHGHSHAHKHAYALKHDHKQAHDHKHTHNNVHSHAVPEVPKQMNDTKETASVCVKDTKESATVCVKDKVETANNIPATLGTDETADGESEPFKTSNINSEKTDNSPAVVDEKDSEKPQDSLVDKESTAKDNTKC